MFITQVIHFELVLFLFLFYLILFCCCEVKPTLLDCWLRWLLLIVVSLCLFILCEYVVAFGLFLKTHMCLSTNLAPWTLRLKGVRPTRVQLILTIALEYAHIVATQTLRLAFYLTNTDLFGRCCPNGTFQWLQIEGHAINWVAVNMLEKKKR